VSGGYILDHTAVRSLAHGSVYLAARIHVSTRSAQPLYVPGVCLAQGLTETVIGEVRQRIEEAFAAPSFVFRPLDELSCWAVAQIAGDRDVDIATAHAAHVGLTTGLPVLTRSGSAYRKIDSSIVTESLP
jgi:hypothetical protein